MSEPVSGFKQFPEFSSAASAMFDLPATLRIGKPLRAAFRSLAEVRPQCGLKWRLFCGLSILLLVRLGGAQPEPGFYWQGVRQIPPTPAALDKIVKAHELWVETNGQAGTRAELSHHNLSNFNLQGANLWGADLEGTDLAGANLTKAILGFDSQKNEQISREPGEFLPPPPGAPQATVRDASGRIISTSQSVPGPTELRGAILWDATLAHADLSDVDLTNAVLTGADLSGADLTGADLTGANLAGARLDGSNLSNANLEGVIFEPVSVDSIIGPESAKNLDRLTFQTNPDALIKIRKRFQDEGLTKQEREVTYALNRRQTQIDSGVDRWFRVLAFDLTCQYGMSPGRPLRIIAVGWAIFSFLYIVLQHRGRHFRIEVRRIYPSRERVREFLMWPAPHHVASKSTRLRGWFRFERRTICAMMFFGLVNAFNLGYREFSVGQWLRMLTRRRYELRAVGWVRSLAGIQSLVSIYLFALWVLTYFGRPFE